MTEVLLTRVAPAARVLTFSQRDEARTGADWLWWWGGGGQWFGVLVQAKRNKPRGGAPWYDFGYRQGSQLNQLLRTAECFGVPAAYVLYNQLPVARTARVSLPGCAVSTETWPTRLRVAVLPALMAELLIGSEDVVPAYARPIECLACPCWPPSMAWVALAPRIKDSELLQFLRDDARDLPHRAARVLLGQFIQQRMGQLRQFTFDEPRSTAAHPPGTEADDRVFVELLDDQGHFREPYFEHVLRGLRSRPPGYVEDALEGASSEEIERDCEGVDGLVILRDPQENGLA